MDSLVNLQVALLGEALAAHFAGKWFLAGVHQHVGLQVAFLGKRFVANWALEGFDSAVSQRVGEQCRLLGEPPMAHGTWKWLFPGMVYLEAVLYIFILWSQKFGWVANKKIPAFVYLVYLEVAFSHELFAAGFALERSLAWRDVNVVVTVAAAVIVVLNGRLVRCGENQRLLHQNSDRLVDRIIITCHETRNVWVVVFRLYFLRPNVVWLLLYHRWDQIIVRRLPNILKI